MQIRLTNDALARALHEPLYKRMLDFCIKYTPQFPGEVVVQAWLSRLYLGDNNLHILVRLDDSLKIVGHAVIDVINNHGYLTVQCHQCHGDVKNIADIDEGAEYIDKLCEQVGAVCAIFFVQKNSKALEKRYGYSTGITAMIKKCVTVDA